jgi:uncharacterized protein (DUF2252 family)
MATTTRPAKTGAADSDGARGAPFASSWRRAHLTVDQRVARGRAARREAPRSEHGRWEPAPGRPDPVTLLEEQGASRVPELVPIRYGRMLVSPFTFYRGAAAIMAADLASSPVSGITVQLCGDAHLSNFGVFGTPERQLIFDINDFDETLPAPWEWDVKRLVASIVLAARSNGLSDSHGRDCAVSCARMYREHMRKFSRMGPLRIWYAKISVTDFINSLPKALQKQAKKRIEKTAVRSGSEYDFPKLAGSVGGQIRISDQPPLIFHPESTNRAGATAILDQLLQRYRESLHEDRRILVDRYRLVDVAIKVVGIGSVGRRCWIALMMSEGNDPLFLQFKEAVQSVLEPYAGRTVYGVRRQMI